jgi:molybdate transport system substrate-binding protein
VRTIGALLASLAVFTACVPGAAGETGRTVRVFAAASLTDVFATIAEDFEDANPDITVELQFAGSSTLAHQINEGAPAGVFASAGPDPMATVVAAGSATGTPRVFARNGLVIAVPAGNPMGIAGLPDLTGPGVRVAACAEPVPCGAAARQAADAAGVRLTPVTLEQDVRAVLAKLRLGEVDAGLVYRTDIADDDIEPVPLAQPVTTDYEVVTLAGASDAAAADDFVAYLLSGAAAAVLTGAGFEIP